MDQREVFVSVTCEGEHCFCGRDAVRKVGEEIPCDDPLPCRHNLTAYVCAEHFAQIMGSAGARDVGLASGWEKRSPAGEAYNRLVSAVRGFLADEDACAEEFAAETGELPAFAQEPFPRVLEMRSALVDIDNAALSTRLVGESAGALEPYEQLRALTLANGRLTQAETRTMLLAADILQSLAARASQPSAGEVEW